MMKHDVEFYLSELSRLLDPHRVYERFGGFGEDALVEELQEYYGQLSDEEKKALSAAVLRWLSSSEDLRRTQAIRLCGDLRLHECVDELLQLGRELRQEDPRHIQLNWIVQALGDIADREALDFLMQEALEGEYSNAAVLGIAEIDEAVALRMVPQLVESYHKDTEPALLTKTLFWLFLAKRGGGIARRLGKALRCFHDKSFLEEQFSSALRELAHGPGGGRPSKRRKQEMLHEFRAGLAAGPCHGE